MAITDIELNFGKPIPKAEERSYSSVCVGIESFVINEGTADAKTLLRWECSLDGLEDPEQPGFNVIVDGATSLATGPKSKMRAWVTAISGVSLDEKISLTGLRQLCVGKPCIVRVTNRDANGIETGYSKVADILPPLAPGRLSAPTPAAAPQAVPTTAAPESLPGDLPFE